MNLTYRGVSYKRQPLSLEVSEGEIGGVYRGQTWRHSQLRHIPQLKPKPYLQYRGVAYSTRPIIRTGARIVCQIEPVRQPVSVRKQRQAPVALDRTHQTHLQNIRRSLEHRLQVAAARGNEGLLDQLQHESQALALNV